MARIARTLADLLARDEEERQAEEWAEEARLDALADLETERLSAQYWEENRSPAYQQECMDDLALFEETWQAGMQGSYRDDEARACNEDYR